MAAKAKAAHSGKKSGAGRVANSARSKPKGMQLTTAQRSAYSKAFSATATALAHAAAIRTRATALRRYRLQSAAAHVRKYNTVHLQAQAASVAAFATSRSLAQSQAGHQNAALRHRIGLIAFHHTTLLGRIQFAEGGQKRYAHAAVMRTLTQAQAVSFESRHVSKVIKNAKRASQHKRGKLRRGHTPLSGAIKAAAARAGMAAAAKVPRSAKAPARGGRASPSKARASAASAKAPSKTAKSRTAPLTHGQIAAAAAHAAAVFTGHAAINGKAKVTTERPPGERDWVGNEYTPNCIVAAVANHLLRAKNIRVSDEAVDELTELAGPEPKIEEVLWQAWLTGWPADEKVRLVNYAAEPWRADRDIAGLVVGYEAQTDDGPGDHCALALHDGKVVSWGTVRDRESEVEEAWDLTWQGLKPDASWYSWRLRRS